MSTTTSQIFKARLESAEIYFGASACRSWVYQDDVASDTNNEFVDINFTNEEDVEVEGYIWFNVGGAGVDPAPAGKTLVAEVAYAANATGADRAAATVAALDALLTTPLFYYKVSPTSTDTLLVDNAYPGEITAESGSGGEKITETELRAGYGGLLGPTKGPISFGSETEFFTILANQTGNLALDTVNQGTSVTISTDILDFSDANKEALIENGVGGAIGTAPNKRIGIGESKLFQNTSDIGGRLILHPIRLDRDDRSGDVVIWNTLAQIGEINYDGTDSQSVALEFQAVLDQGRQSEVNLVVFGEWIDNALLD